VLNPTDFTNFTDFTADPKKKKVTILSGGGSGLAAPLLTLLTTFTDFCC
jgi:hypothetical protein